MLCIEVKCSTFRFFYGFKNAFMVGIFYMSKMGITKKYLFFSPVRYYDLKRIVKSCVFIFGHNVIDVVGLPWCVGAVPSESS